MTITELLRTSKGLLSVRQVAEALGSHPQTIYGWVYDGVIPYVRVGRRVKFDGSKVAEWLDKRSA